ncbi:MAG: hypothetical protein ACK5Q5_15215 [Planctomycetaceae bacterium]
MQRRQALRTLLCGLAASPLCGAASLFAQNPTGRAQLGQTATVQPTAGQLGARPAPNFAPNQEVTAALQRWERYTRNIQRLHGQFERYIYDSTFLVERRAEGEFWYENPDKARIDLRPSTRLPEADANGMRLNPRKLGANGKPFSVQPDSGSRWVCRGDALLIIDDLNKNYDVLDIPPHMQGQNITKSPLPFVFGINAEAMERRYLLNPGVMETYQNRPIIHLVAYPKMQSDAKEWQRAEVLLDPGTYFQDSNREPIYIPVAIKLLDPSGQTETVYVFYPGETKLNQSLLWGNPFKDPGLLSGYKIGTRQTLAAGDEQQRTVETPAGGNSQLR